MTDTDTPLSNRPQLKVSELIEHPEYAHVTWPLQPTKKDKVAVATNRGGPFNIAYEIHGHGPIHMVWIMGLAGFKTAWQRQTKDFGHDQGSKYQCLIFDNRGIGESDKPTMRYSTLEMAKDVVELLDYVGWTEKRQLHIIGVSMGGMIAQELGLLIPERTASLTLMSTAARLENTVGFVENLRQRINMFIPKDLDIQLDEIKARLASSDFINSPDTEGTFPTMGDRFAAQEVKKRCDTEGFTRKGFMLQAIAAGWHHKSADQLRELGDKVGRDRIQVLHGTIDNMIPFVHYETLMRELGGKEQGVTGVVFENKGHILPMEERERVRKLMEEMVEKTAALDDDE
ncbi:MAG: hypothetical protein M1834_009730 [Cirrosporium novae-zelandiae]|nr:MAG: hypothetical protein M1834_009730 [Cirrosporium novae-zelandiae]